ncbi:hypothetical protein CPAR01_11804 [Colletotrichum paranaense]|uniref:Uncharacterized protein n=2 Tax=Colletotrichum acutatum species complex TaxID=2707335 RepID=A0AAI9V994_9PEZI|nr:uncharacterized protein CPAR01_11804 [Colletotrichum paranaense]KAK1471599.1 hypothetical protein CCUS01_06083 [Colletotrichum cuscutae]KAK1529492.1 hypothetical protein CPAR01_11804 [Colletotrichum paranaense]
MSATIFGLSCGIEPYIASVGWGCLHPTTCLFTRPLQQY